MSQSAENDERIIRSFIALDISSPVLLKAIGTYQTKLQKSIGPLKLVDPALMHLTLVFLGNISVLNARKIYEIVERMNAKYFQTPVESQIKGVGNFKKNVYFVKINKEIEQISQINTELQSILQDQLHIKPDTKPFAPHITIARARRNRIPQDNPGQISYSKLKQQYQDFEFGTWRIPRIVLKKSVLTPTGPIYSNLSF